MIQLIRSIEVIVQGHLFLNACFDAGLIRASSFVGSPLNIHVQGNLLATTSAPTSHYRHPSFPSYDHPLLPLHCPKLPLQAS